MYSPRIPNAVKFAILHKRTSGLSRLHIRGLAQVLGWEWAPGVPFYANKSPLYRSALAWLIYMIIIYS